jgi:hypothetical protein
MLCQTLHGALHVLHSQALPGPCSSQALEALTKIQQTAVLVARAHALGQHLGAQDPQSGVENHRQKYGKKNMKNP